MAITWLDFKTETYKFLSDVTSTDDLFASACAAYVKSMIVREVDHDVVLSKSYWNYYTDMRRRLLGYVPTLSVGSTLDVAVRILLPVDDERQGIQSYLTQQIKNAYAELTGLNNFLDKTTREAVIDLQSYVQCYRFGEETVYTVTDVTTQGNLSRGPLPEQGELAEAFLLTQVQDLAENVAYNPGDYVASNGRTYRVIKGGTIITGALGGGLLKTDGQQESIGGLTFIFYYGESCFRSEIVPLPWENRFMLNQLRDGCHGDRSSPAMLAIDNEAYSFYVWPKLDATHTLSIFWSGLKFDFADGDHVPLDETAQQAVKEYVLARFYIQIEHDQREAAMHENMYRELRTRCYVDCSRRKELEYSK